MKIRICRQVCFVHMALEEFDQLGARLQPGSFTMATDIELSQYFIQSWDITYRDTTGEV